MSLCVQRARNEVDIHRCVRNRPLVLVDPSGRQAREGLGPCVATLGEAGQGDTERAAMPAMVRLLIGVLILLGSLFGYQTSARGAMEGHCGADEAAAQEWLRLDWGGGSPSSSANTLCISPDGTVTLAATYTDLAPFIGLYEFAMDQESLGQCRELVRPEDLRQLADDYPARDPDSSWMEITLRDEVGVKRVHATSSSPDYPCQLARLFDIRKDRFEVQGRLPSGLLAVFVNASVSACPVAAVDVRMELPKTTYHVGEEISATLVVRNVGTRPVALPSPASKVLVIGGVSVTLEHHPHRPAGEWIADLSNALFGKSSFSWAERLDCEALEDLSEVICLAPGEETRAFRAKPVIAQEPGLYRLGAGLDMMPLYPSDLLQEHVKGHFIHGGTGTGWVKVLVEE